MYLFRSMYLIGNFVFFTEGQVLSCVAIVYSMLLHRSFQLLANSGFLDVIVAMPLPLVSSLGLQARRREHAYVGVRVEKHDG